jgi:hypothetical protein
MPPSHISRFEFAITEWIGRGGSANVIAAVCCSEKPVPATTDHKSFPATTAVTASAMMKLSAGASAGAVPNDTKEDSKDSKHSKATTATATTALTTAALAPAVTVRKSPRLIEQKEYARRVMDSARKSMLRVPEV